MITIDENKHVLVRNNSFDYKILITKILFFCSAYCPSNYIGKILYICFFFFYKETKITYSRVITLNFIKNFSLVKEENRDQILEITNQTQLCKNHSNKCICYGH